jgi:uncharacterized protein involved in response to NO
MTADSPNAPRLPLIALLAGVFYLLFTLLPDSSTTVLSWPWVLIWQVGLICPYLWLLQQLVQTRRWIWLGQGLDGLIGLGILGLGVSAIVAPYPRQAGWHTWIALCLVAALYALTQWLTPARRIKLLTWQGYLGLAFILVSLGLWTTQTWWSELSRLQQIQQQFGVSLPFDFGALQNRNWAPLGHQNYVAGYLTLILPLFAGLALTQSGRQRWLWCGGLALGLLDLYTTTSRAGWLGLMVAAIVTAIGYVTQTQKIKLSRPGLLLGVGGLLGVPLLLLWGTGRLQTLFQPTTVSSTSGDFVFRSITWATGWAMGWQQPFTGQGLGSVPLLYQKFRPVWAGREAELVFQLHSTPAQLWAELGAIGLLLMLGITIWLLSRWWQDRHHQSPLIHSLFAALLAYGIQSLTDYQLDLICISGVIILYIAAIALEPTIITTLQTTLEPRPAINISPIVPAFGMGLLLALLFFLVPINRAWMLSSQGFIALAQVESAKTPDDRNAALDQFVQNLTQAHQLVPWEAYYPYQLGWVLGDIGRQGDRPRFEQALPWFTVGNQLAPNQEFGHSNLGWLLLTGDPKAAQQAFQQAAQLVPAKRGVFYGLGMSLLYQGNVDLAVNAIALDLLRDPAFLTSLVWQAKAPQLFYTQVSRRLEALYTDLMGKTANERFIRYLRACRGGLRWWTDNLSGAREDAMAAQDTRLLTLLDLSEGKSVDWQTLPEDASKYAIAAWLNPAERDRHLQKAWILAQNTAPPSALISELRTAMDQSKTLTQWLRENAVSKPDRRRRLGFNVLSRHTDGVNPQDFFTEVNNVPMDLFFSTILQSMIYFPDLDMALQELRSDLFSQLS